MLTFVVLTLEERNQTQLTHLLGAPHFPVLPFALLLVLTWCVDFIRMLNNFTSICEPNKQFIVFYMLEIYTNASKESIIFKTQHGVLRLVGMC